MQYDGLKERKLGPLSLGLHTGRNLGSSGRGAVTCTETGVKTGTSVFLDCMYDGKMERLILSFKVLKVKDFKKKIWKISLGP